MRRIVFDFEILLQAYIWQCRNLFRDHTENMVLPIPPSILNTGSFLSLPLLLPVRTLSGIAARLIVPSPAPHGSMAPARDSIRCCGCTNDLTARFTQKERQPNLRGLPYNYLPRSSCAARTLNSA